MSDFHDPEALAWYAQAPVADAHADSLLWNRDLNRRSDSGHVDLPRLREAGVKIQIFTIPTRGWPVVDGMRAFCWFRGWPRAARRDARSRAIYQIEMLHRACERSGGEASVVRTAAELDANIKAGRLSAILGMEGAYPLQSNIQDLDQFWSLGLRVLGPAHLIPNQYSSCSFWFYRDRGIGGAGRELLKEMERLGMILDVAHASPRALDEMLSSDFSNIKTFTSHTGVNGATRHWRNLSDAHLQAIAARNGIVAIILARIYLGGARLSHFMRHVDHAARIAGPRNVAIGSDFDGFVRLPREMRDVCDFSKIAVALRASGRDREESISILGGALAHFLRHALPPGKECPPDFTKQPCSE